MSENLKLCVILCAGLGSSRPSAAAALKHRFIQTTPFPQSFNFPSVVPDFSSLSFPSPSQLQLPVFSSSALKTATSQVGNIQDAVANIDQERISTAISAAAPTAATSAFAIGAGWMVSSSYFVFLCTLLFHLILLLVSPCDLNGC